MNTNIDTESLVSYAAGKWTTASAPTALKYSFINTGGRTGATVAFTLVSPDILGLVKGNNETRTFTLQKNAKLAPLPDLLVLTIDTSKLPWIKSAAEVANAVDGSLFILSLNLKQGEQVDVLHLASGLKQASPTTVSAIVAKSALDMPVTAQGLYVHEKKLARFTVSLGKLSDLVQSGVVGDRRIP